METLEAIKRRVSVRQYTDEPLSEDEVQAILKAGFSAPSALNKQPWAFYVLESKEAREAVQKALPFARYGSPLIIVVAIDKDLVFEHGGIELATADVSAATENMLLAATALGLGSVWCAIYPDPKRVDSVVSALSLPANLLPYACIHFGHAKTEAEPKEKYDEKKIHRI